MNLIQIEVLKTKLETDLFKQKTIVKIAQYTQTVLYLNMLMEYEKKKQLMEIGEPLLIKTYEEYIKLITNENIALAQIAVPHGYTTKDEWVKLGQEFRATIDKLKRQMV